MLKAGRYVQYLFYYNEEENTITNENIIKILTRAQCLHKNLMFTIGQKCMAFPGVLCCSIEQY